MALRDKIKVADNDNITLIVIDKDNNHTTYTVNECTGKTTKYVSTKESNKQND